MLKRGFFVALMGMLAILQVYAQEQPQPPAQAPQPQLQAPGQTPATDTQQITAQPGGAPLSRKQIQEEAEKKAKEAEAKFYADEQQKAEKTTQITPLDAIYNRPPEPSDVPKSNPNELLFYNGVKLEVLRPGTGPRPAPNATVQIQYIGHLEDGTEFDRSYSRKKASVYRLSHVIGCWQTGIPEMNVGSKVKLTCPPGSANGKRPVDFIWGDTTLYFIIELIDIIGY